MTPHEEARSKLIKAVQEKSRFWDAVASSESIEAVRNPSAKSQQRAAAYCARMDAAHKLAGEVIELINANWPREKTQ